MPHAIEDLRREAQKEFLGQDPVIGVAIGRNSENELLVFMLDEASSEMEQRIRSWAQERGVEVRIQLNGPIALLSLA